MNSFITSAESLVTTHEQIRSGFLEIALEKNRVGDPYVRQAFAFRSMVAHTHSPDELLNISNVRTFMLTAAGLSEKSLQHLDENDHMAVLKELIDKFLKPAGNAYIDEVIYRFLLTKGDAVGGIMRNRIGAIGQEKLIRCILSCLSVRGRSYSWYAGNQNKGSWYSQVSDDTGIEKNIKALYWKNNDGEDRVLGFNLKIAIVNKNVDICLFSADRALYRQGKIAKDHSQLAIMLGELKGGIDPAGADEHWKTANTALDRIRTSYNAINTSMLTSFVGAAIERAMATEIFDQLQCGTLSNAANLTDMNQLVEYCNWLLDL